MTDITTNEPLRVRTESPDYPFIRAEASQLDPISRLLTEKGIRHWLEGQHISFNGGPYMGKVNFPYGTNAVTIQQILDSVP